MTYEELLNNYQYKITKKGLMREFPFIKDVLDTTKEDFENYRTTLFITIVIDPYVVALMYNTEVWGGITRALKRGETFESPGLRIFFEDKNVGSDIVYDMNKLIQSVNNSAALPMEYKLRDKVINIGHYEARPDSLPPDFMSQPN